jgi:hypothetical protein
MTQETTSSAWDLEEVPDRNKVLWHIANQVKSGVPREQLEQELPAWLEANQFQFQSEDIQGMLDWAYRRFGKPSNG